MGCLYSDQDRSKLQVEDLWQKWLSGRRNKEKPLLIYCEESDSDESDDPDSEGPDESENIFV